MKRSPFNGIGALAVLGLFAVAIVTGGCPKREMEIYVAPDGDCKPGVGRPFRRIGDAIGYAKQLRMDPNLDNTKIIVIMKPAMYVGTYTTSNAACVQNAPQATKEELPLTIDISDFELRGQTVLLEENGSPVRDGVPKSTRLDRNLTVIRPDGPLAEQAIILVKPPDRGRVKNVAINGLVLWGIRDGFSGTGTGIFIDRTSQLSVHGNELRDLQVGLRTRGSNGVINQNVARNNITAAGGGVGFIASGGSKNHPAGLWIVNNYATGNTLGILLIAPGTYQTEPPKVTFEFDLPRDENEVPDTLEAVVAGNVLEANALAGLRVFAAAQLKATYTTRLPMSQPISTKVVLECRNNSFVGNARYGIAVDAGFSGREHPFMYQITFRGLFEKNKFINNEKVFFGFERLQKVLAIQDPKTICVSGNPQLCWKPLADSILDITDPRNELEGFHYAHPEMDGNSLLRNSLKVNGQSRAFGNCTHACPP